MENVSHFPMSMLHSDISDQRKGKSFGTDYLINKLNYTNFQDGTILLTFKHVKYNRTISRHAKPLPCQGNRLECCWVDPKNGAPNPASYRFHTFFVSDGRKLLMVPAQVQNISGKGASFLLPESCNEIIPRKAQRLSAKGVKVHLSQNSASFHGKLKDFSSLSFQVEVTTTPPQTFGWLNFDYPVHLMLSTGDHISYSGNCRLKRQSLDQRARSIVIEIIDSRISRFRPKKFRSTRQELVPSPNIVFTHPLTGKIVNRKIIDLSGTGFAVVESKENSVLIPGLIIADLQLRFADGFQVGCMAQVVYCRDQDGDGEKNLVKCGLAILDMDGRAHMKILALLHQAKDSHSYLCAKVDMEGLWKFFFETGFIYPKKYAFIQQNKDRVKALYEQLYNDNPKIARHFIFQDHGEILGHMAMLRFYRNTWLIHHHAADKSQSTRAGLAVLNQIGRFINDSHRLYSIHMDYVICYYRPQNRFPHRIFGGAAKRVANPKGCSLDSFAYFHYSTAGKRPKKLNRPWSLDPGQDSDLMELESFYEQESGGLMIPALDLAPHQIDSEELLNEYRQLGFKKERRIFSLTKNGVPKAVIILHLSDIGLNMSDLTNCVKIIVLEPEELPHDIFFSLLGELDHFFQGEEMPTLLYPLAYAEDNDISFEKIYNLWILNLQHTDDYFHYLNRLLRVIEH